MTRLKLVAAAAVLSTMMVAPGNGTAYTGATTATATVDRLTRPPA